MEKVCSKLSKWKWLIPQLSYRVRILVTNNLVRYLVTATCWTYWGNSKETCEHFLVWTTLDLCCCFIPSGSKGRTRIERYQIQQYGFLVTSSSETVISYGCIMAKDSFCSSQVGRKSTLTLDTFSKITNITQVKYYLKLKWLAGLTKKIVWNRNQIKKISSLGCLEFVYFSFHNFHIQIIL